MVSVYGTREFFKWLAVYFNDNKTLNTVSILFFISIIVYTLIAYNGHKTEYSDQTHHISVRNLAAAKWLNENTSENSVIATHDIGAIGYYTKRRIVDIAGLVSPQFTALMYDSSFPKFMVEEMKRQNVTHTAFMREWYLVVNQNPLFTCSDDNTEMIIINKFDPEKTHVLSREMNSSIMFVMDLLAQRQVQQAQQILSRLTVMDPLSSNTYYLLANTQFALGDLAGSEKNLKKSLEIFPEYRDANFALAEIYKRENKTEEAKKQIQNFLKIIPGDTAAVNLLKLLSSDTGSTKGK
jgi:hypothetical protein